MTLALETAGFNLALALALGAVIGSERQIRQRMAGLRTNALVALGAAGFVLFSQLFPAEVSPTRVAAQVVSGIGFLGAGIIFRDGFNIHGLNTAATLWCSAGVGMMAGAGAWQVATLFTGLVVFVNLGLRPLVKLLKRYTSAGLPLSRSYRVVATCQPEREAELRAMILRVLAPGGLRLSEFAARPVAEGTELSLVVTGEVASEQPLDQALERIAGEPGLVGLSWHAVEDG